MSVFVSFYHFLLDWFYTAEEFQFCDMVETLLYKRSVPIWSHYYEYFQAAKKHPNQILFLFFEDIVAKREQAVRKVAQFIGVDDELAEERIATALKYSEFNWMKTNEHLFDEAPNKRARNKIFGAVGDKASKIRAGKTTIDSMDPLLREEIETVLQAKFKEHFGVATYEELRTLVQDSDIQSLD